MSDINKVILRGRLDGKPELRATQQSHVTNFTLVTQGERQKYPQRHRCVAWSTLAKQICALDDAAPIHCVGRLQTRSYADRETGEKKYVTEVVLDEILDNEHVTTEDGQEEMPF